MTLSRHSALALVAMLAALFGAALSLGIVALADDSPAPRPQPATGVKPGAADVGFAQDMIVHHDQALVMARLATARSVSAPIRTYADQILLSQAREQGMLQGWLALWGKPTLAKHPMSWMHVGETGHDHGKAGTMPGMATPAELSRLSRLRAAGFEREFLRLMTRHHIGGIEMAQLAAKRADLPVVRSLAAMMARDQAEEVAAFRRLAAHL